VRVSNPPVHKDTKMETQPQTLKELRASLKTVDVMRRAKEITDTEREALELTSVALREAERVAIAKIQKQTVEDMRQQTAGLAALSKVIRARVTRMNKMPKVLNDIETVIKTAVKIVAAIAKW